MTRRHSPLISLALTVCAFALLPGCESKPAGKASAGFTLNGRDYFQNRGVGVMVYADNYADTHQSGVIMINHGIRIATNGDLRLEPAPGQWSPSAKLMGREVDRAGQAVRVRLAYPNEAKHHVGFNPLHYPELELAYDLIVTADGDALDIRVNLDQPLPPEWAGKVGFVLELSPADLFGKAWYLDESHGIFPRQPYGVQIEPGIRTEPKLVPDNNLKDMVPLVNHRAEPAPLASGRRLSVAPESDELHTIIESHQGELELLDGRVQHQNGWFIVRSPVAAGATDNAVHWTLRPNVIKDWVSPPVIQHSMVGYHPAQRKVAVIETDPNDDFNANIQLLRLSSDGRHETVLDKTPQSWGDMLRYRYYLFDFSEVTREGMYQLALNGNRGEPFRIAADVYDRNVWQPTLDYFLPIQMAHMRVKEKYKLWHDASHLDDALMAPVDLNHFDGYKQGPSTLTRFKPGEHVPGLNRGGWYDAGDDDLRVESQAGEVFILSMIYGEFGIDHDTTLIDQNLRLVELREPDGLPDVLQQIEHGLLTVVGGYQALGRLYRGIIVPTLTQYVMGGDFSGQTDNLIYDSRLPRLERTATHSGLPDDRWVFTEENPVREFEVIADLAAAVKPMRGYNDALADDTLAAAVELWATPRPAADDRTRGNKLRAAVELFLATGDAQYRQHILAERDFILQNFRYVGWFVARAVHALDDNAFTAELQRAAEALQKVVDQRITHTPYGLSIDFGYWGQGWVLQREAVAHYFLHKAFPDVFGHEYLLNVVHYVLGANPGSNNQSYVSGVGARSKTSAYGFNRMDYSYIPGGVINGTALIAPDFMELKSFPYFWQQSEYVMGGGATNFMFLALAADRLLNKR
ncbi:MAG TPA: glycoside hydrolase family 9 protein [Gammaproteobacteria bacterium]